MIIYLFLLYCALPFILLRLFWRGFKAPKYWQRWPERFGFFKFHQYSWIKNKKIVWLHAVSVGEVLAAKPLINEILKHKKNVYLVVTTTTPTGSDQVMRLFGDKVFHVYAPYDFPGSVNRFLKRIKPALFLIMETEIWPNMVVECKKRQIPIVLVNGRLSEKSLNRYKVFSSFSSSIFKKIDAICAQSDSDALRFSTLSAKNVAITGNIKSDIDVSQSLYKKANDYKCRLFANSERLIIVAASTHKGEDEIIISAYLELKEKFPSLLLILVPRHPERFDSVASLCSQKNMNVIRKSSNEPVSNKTDVLLGDTMGDLFMLYGICDIAIMGGTFIDRGGHNFLEPAAWGVPVVSGKSVYNFSVIAKEMEKMGALSQVDEGGDLVTKLEELLVSQNLREQQGLLAKNYLEEKRGALNNVIDIIEPLIGLKK